MLSMIKNHYFLAYLHIVRCTKNIITYSEFAFEYLLQIVIAIFTNDAWKVRNARSVLERKRRDTPPVSYSIVSYINFTI